MDHRSPELHVSGGWEEKGRGSEVRGQGSTQRVFKKELVKKAYTRMKIILRGGERERGEAKTFIGGKSYGANYRVG